MCKFYNILIIIILFFAAWGSFDLSKTDWLTGDVCPKVLGIPACYIVFICFTIALLSQFFQFSKSDTVYFISIGLVFSLASFGTTGEIFGFAKCPRTSNGIPMCFISFGITTTLLMIKYVQLKLNS